VPDDLAAALTRVLTGQAPVWGASMTLDDLDSAELSLADVIDATLRPREQ
jgi:hypothetical protein